MAGYLHFTWSRVVLHPVKFNTSINLVKKNMKIYQKYTFWFVLKEVSKDIIFVKDSLYYVDQINGLSFISVKNWFYKCEKYEKG
jgi:hypothetical protein